MTVLASWQVRMAGVERLLCQAHMRLAAGLLRAGHLQPFPAPFNSGEQHFEQRFAALHPLQRPEPLSYQQYARSMDVSCEPLSFPAYRAILSLLSMLCKAQHMIVPLFLNLM